MTYSASCCGPGHGARRYFSKAERTDWLESYAKELENELTGVRERLQELKE